MPCYDFSLVTNLILGPTYVGTSDKTDFPAVTGGEYKAQGRIHRGVADPRLLAIPASWGRVADLNPNWDQFWWD